MQFVLINRRRRLLLSSFCIDQQHSHLHQSLPDHLQCCDPFGLLFRLPKDWYHMCPASESKFSLLKYRRRFVIRFSTPGVKISADCSVRTSCSTCTFNSTSSCGWCRSSGKCEWITFSNVLCLDAGSLLRAFYFFATAFEGINIIKFYASGLPGDFKGPFCQTCGGGACSWDFAICPVSEFNYYIDITNSISWPHCVFFSKKCCLYIG